MKLAADLLELAGFCVLKAFDGESALEILKTERPDLIVLDIGLPGIRGSEVYARVRANPDLRSVKVVAFTASVMKQEREKMIEDGFDAFVTKPINTQQFVRIIKALLEGKSLSPDEKFVQ